MKKSLGRVGMKVVGNYDNLQEYNKLDVVLYEGSSYVCHTTSEGNLPTDPDYWFLIASKGEIGPKGDQGETGLTGDTGLSAYELAVENGFTGDEEDWLEMLKGEIPVASSSLIGGIKVGNNLTITDGVLSADQQVNITISEDDPTGGSNGDIWFVYES